MVLQELFKSLSKLRYGKIAVSVGGTVLGCGPYPERGMGVEGFDQGESPQGKLWDAGSSPATSTDD